MPCNTGDVEDDDRVSTRPLNAATSASAASPLGLGAAADDSAGDGSAVADAADPHLSDRIRAHRRRYRRGRHATKRRLDPRLAPIAAAVAVAAISGSAWAIAAPSDKPATSPAPALILSDAAERAAAADGAASRNYARPMAAATTPQAKSAATKQKSSRAPRATRSSAAPSATKADTATSASPSPSPSPTDPAPVGGLSEPEMHNAIAIVRAGQQMNLPKRAFVVAISTALQESHLHNLANPNVPGSMDHPNEGVGYDHASVGLFQQQPNWGTVDQLMDPMEAARRFYAALVAIPGWEQLDITVAAQRVQVSAFPDAYAKWQGLAEQIVNAIAP
ncbi:peptidase M23 [Planosporangium thailandense]|uniref:Peptidase M23 n=1 Tax=Planosporangium thailandense TaxID=765197 RepID=A0ABX0Y9I0_9ACTN|nr:peptidase M23 [Planosporangium thailandense]NJC74048.1 peptidase M23 [Planosporangium thailandense]